MPRLRVSLDAVAHIDAISAWIARDRPSAAARVGARLWDTFDFLARNPNAGTCSDDVLPGLRVFVPGSPASRYLVCFRFDEPADALEILAVIDGAREWKAALRGG